MFGPIVIVYFGVDGLGPFVCGAYIHVVLVHILALALLLNANLNVVIKVGP